ncbi:MAG: hypothetical protein AABP62_20360 [Planctomycetota bacterium]
MALMTTPTGSSIFDPSPDDQSAVTLILGGERLECRLVEVSLGDFGVLVPRSTAWMGDQNAKLLTHDTAYPVRILKQEPHRTSYRFTLQRIRQDEHNIDHLGLPQRWIIHTSRCCTIGLIAAMTYCFVANPGGSSKGAHRVRPRDVINYWMQPWQTTGWQSSHRDPAASKTERAATTVSHGEAWPLNR